MRTNQLVTLVPSLAAAGPSFEDGSPAAATLVAGRADSQARLGRALRLLGSPGLRMTRSWTTIAAFLCGGAGAIPFALESHSAVASGTSVAAVMGVSGDGAESVDVAKLLKPGEIVPGYTPRPESGLQPRAQPGSGSGAGVGAAGGSKRESVPAGQPTPPGVRIGSDPARDGASGDEARTGAPRQNAKQDIQHDAKRDPKSDAKRVGETGDGSRRDATPAKRVAHRDGDDAVPMFNGRPVRAVRTMTMRVTAYSPDERSCGASADNITASGYSVWTNGGRLVAADTSVLPLGSLVSIPGYDAGGVVPVLDRGGAIKGNRLDVLFPSHEQARRWGVRDVTVTIYEYDDGEPNGFREAHAKRRTAAADDADVTP